MCVCFKRDATTEVIVLFLWKENISTQILWHVHFNSFHWMTFYCIYLNSYALDNVIDWINRKKRTHQHLRCKEKKFAISLWLFVSLLCGQTNAYQASKSVAAGEKGVCCIWIRTMVIFAVVTSKEPQNRIMRQPNVNCAAHLSAQKEIFVDDSNNWFFGIKLK